MKIFYFLIFIVSITFSQNEIKHSDIIGEWEIKIKVKQLLKEEIKELDMFEKMAAELASGLAEDILNSADMYIEFKTNEIASKTYEKISKNGLITTLIQGNIIRITPPLIINQKELKKGLNIISKIL